MEMCTEGMDLTALVSHRFALSQWREAFATLMSKGRSGALKVVLEPDLD
jgi:threonine dehydrogenase-like Zn-dependent dehydrogenase